MGGIHVGQANLVRDGYVWREAYWLKGHIHALHSLKLMVRKHFREFIRYLIFASKSLSIHHFISQSPWYKQTSAICQVCSLMSPGVLSDVVSCCVSQQNCPQWPEIKSSYREEKLHQNKKERMQYQSSCLKSQKWLFFPPETTWLCFSVENWAN